MQYCLSGGLAAVEAGSCFRHMESDDGGCDAAGEWVFHVEGVVLFDCCVVLQTTQLIFLLIMRHLCPREGVSRTRGACWPLIACACRSAPFFSSVARLSAFTLDNVLCANHIHFGQFGVRCHRNMSRSCVWSHLGCRSKSNSASWLMALGYGI